MKDREQGAREARLTRLKVVTTQRLSKEFVRDFQAELVEDILTNTITGYFKSYVWAESDNLKEVVVEYPADWWQAFKERWLPGLPVKYNRKRLVAKCLYPDFTPAVPGQEFRIAVFKEDCW